MRKFEVISEDTKGEELTAVLRNLPYVKEIKESRASVDICTLAFGASLAEDWLSEEDDELQKRYGKEITPPSTP